MKKRKGVPRIAVLMATALLITGITLIFAISVGDSKDTELKEPEYMSKLFDKDKLLEINIDIDENDFNNLKENATEEEYCKADITINGETLKNVGIRAKGNSSLSQVASDDTTDRYSFKIKTDEYIDNQNIYGLSKFVLNNNIGDATNMKEYMSYDLLNNMGISTPGFAYADIKINNQEWGLYLAVESIEEEFISRNYGNSNGNLYKVETANMGKNNEDRGPGIDDKNGQMPPEANGNGQQMKRPEENNQSNENQIESGQVKEGDFQGGPGAGGPGAMSGNGGNLAYSDDNISSYSSIFDYTVLDTTTKSDKKRLIKIIKNLNEGTNLDENIDVDEVLKYFAVNTFLVNLDSYAGRMKHNYYIYEDDGKMQILPWDYNLSYGAFMMQGGGMGKMQQGNDSHAENSQTSQVINFPIDKPVTDSMENSPLIAKLLEVDEYKEKYHEYLQEIVDKYVNTGYFSEEIDKVDNLISDYVKNDATAFFTYDEYKESLPELKQYGVDRGKSIAAQLEGTQPSEDYGDIESTVNMQVLGQQMGGHKDYDMKNINGNVNGQNQGQQAGPENINPHQMQNNLDMTEDKNMMMPPGMQIEEDSNITLGGISIPVSVVIAMICLLIMIIAIVVVSRIRRKKEYCK